VWVEQVGCGRAGVRGASVHRMFPKADRPPRLQSANVPETGFTSRLLRPSDFGVAEAVAHVPADGEGNNAVRKRRGAREPRAGASCKPTRPTLLQENLRTAY